MSDDFLIKDRRVVAEHIGIDLARQLTITEEYLNKKCMAENLGLRDRFGAFLDPIAK
jgi:hypothetical protein